MMTEPLAQIKSTIASLEKGPSTSTKDEKKLKKVPVPDEKLMDWQLRSTNKIIFHDLVSMVNAVNRF